MTRNFNNNLLQLVGDSHDVGMGFQKSEADDISLVIEKRYHVSISASLSAVVCPFMVAVSEFSSTDTFPGI